MIWRLLADDAVGAADGLATDEALMKPSAEIDRPPTVRLYTYRSHCALVGRFQDTAAELDLAACARTGTEVNRRPTGGGAIVMGADQLGVAVVTHLRRPEVPSHARAIIAAFGRGVAAGLARLGVRGEVRGKNDIAVDGRKIAGLGVYIDERDAVLFHASVLVDLDIDFMLEVLRVPAAKLADKGVASVAQRVTTVREQSGSALSTDDVRACVAVGIEEVFGVRLVRDVLDDAERHEVERTARARYRDPAWVMLRSSGDAPEGTSVLKTPGGLLRVHAALDGDAIKSVLITGDFMATERGLVGIEERLRWVAPVRKRVEAAVAGGVAAGGGPAGVETAELAAAIWQAVADAKARRGMPGGSCYYPPAPVEEQAHAVVTGRNA